MKQTSEKSLSYSNCLIEAIKAKLKWKSKIRIIFIPPWQNDHFCPHFMWTDGISVFDWYAQKNEPLAWYEELWHKGWIRKRSLETYLRYESVSSVRHRKRNTK